MKSLKNDQIQAVLKKGKRVSSRFFDVIYIFDDELGFGIIVSKKHGNAVVRNRIRRRIKEIIKSYQPMLSTGLHASIIPRPGISKQTYWEMLDDFAVCLKKARLVK
ncbi:ribonuclease P protein component [Candidatus Saganbacteria bacterium]|nr:ribonuclease P protein component [Candidatus Saganbacteria bacterium]